MATIAFKGNTIHTISDLPKVGQVAPSFKATTGDLVDVDQAKYFGKTIILNIFPSLDTSVCSSAMRRFNELSNQLPGVAILCISCDLPFAQQRFCSIENLKNVTALSIFRHPEFGKNYGVLITDGPLQGLLARSVVVIDKKGQVLYTELVKEITDEPNYSGMLTAIQKAGIVA